jgi:hypothetical protein
VIQSLRQVGFFRELESSPDDGPVLRDAVRAEASPDEQRMVAYLKAAPVLAATGQLVGDVLAEASTAVAPLEIHTDGEWVWPADLAYYLAHYHVALPAELWARAAANAWQPPVLSAAELSDAVVRFTSG